MIANIISTVNSRGEKGEERERKRESFLWKHNKTLITSLWYRTETGLTKSNSSQSDYVSTSSSKPVRSKGFPECSNIRFLLLNYGLPQTICMSRAAQCNQWCPFWGDISEQPCHTKNSRNSNNKSAPVQHNRSITNQGVLWGGRKARDPEAQSASPTQWKPLASSHWGTSQKNLFCHAASLYSSINPQ